nr:MAG TPA: hypothetical protein [Caudoviricetes sp.]
MLIAASVEEKISHMTAMRIVSLMNSAKVSCTDGMPA